MRLPVREAHFFYMSFKNNIYLCNNKTQHYANYKRKNKH